MKTPLAALAAAAALCATSLCAGSALAQNRPQTPAVGTVPVDQGQGQTRGIGTTPVNGIGGTGGGRLSNVPPVNDPDENVAAQAPINTSRSNIKRPSAVVAGPGTGAGTSVSPVAPTPIPPR